MVESVLAVIGIFFMPMIMVIFITWLVFDEKHKRYKLQADLYAKALEKGQSVSANLFAELQIQKKRNPLNTGIICIAVGIGISLFIWLSKGAVPHGFSAYQHGYQFDRAVALGIIPFLIGVAYLIIHFIEKKKATKEDAK
jgi:purine-cytosine permease-like protein